jgi:hypothetical protein
MEDPVLFLTDLAGKRIAAVIEITYYNALLKRLEYLRANTSRKPSGELPASKKEQEHT